MECKISGCRNLQTTCVTCGRVVCTKILPPRQEWISINDKLPKQYELVLFFRKRDDYYSHVCAFLDENNMIIGPSDFDIYINLEEITHWMPLPKLSKNIYE